MEPNMTEREAEQLRKEYYQLCNDELYVGTSIKDIKNRLSGIHHPTETVQTIRCLLDLIQEQAAKHNGIVKRKRKSIETTFRRAGMSL